MRYPDFLKKNGKIGFIAPSFGCASGYYKARFDKALEFFESKGYKPIIGDNCRKECGVGKSNTAVACGDEINKFFTEDICDIVISVGGGETMCEDLEYINFEALKNSSPKWFMGYSDNTVLCYTLATLCDTASIYGPNASSYGMDPLHPSLIHALEVLSGERKLLSSYDGWEIEGTSSEENPYESYNITQEEDIHLLEGDTAKFSGRLLGGCMDIISVICGTKYDGTAAFLERYKDDGIIWFLESCDMSMMDVRRTLWKFKNAGYFKYVKGFIIGRPFRYGEVYMGVTSDLAYRDMVSEFGVPIITDVDLGHLPPQMPLVEGSMADVEFDGDKLSVKLRFE